MATRTISNTGGNYNATGTWVEGIVPTSADDVVSTATSGQLTINVTSAALSFNLSNYTNTLTMNANWGISGNGVTCTFGANMFFAGTFYINFTTSGSQTIVQNNTRRIPALQISGGTRTLSTNLYCGTFQPNVISSPIINGNIIYINGNVGPLAINQTLTGPSGTTKFILDGSGLLNITTSNQIEVNTTGTYSTWSGGITLVNAVSGSSPTFSFIAGNIGVFNVYCTKSISATEFVNIDCRRRITGLYLYNAGINPLNAQCEINLATTLHVDVLGTFPVFRTYTTDWETPTYAFKGAGISASTLSLSTTHRTTSSTTIDSNFYTYKGPSIKLSSDSVHNFGRITALGGGIPTRPMISSYTASVVASINLASKETSQIVDYNFQDINAVGQQIVAIGGTISNTTNVTTTYPSGGGGVAGGSFTFVN